MLQYIKKKLEKRKVKRTFKEYGYEVNEFNLSDEGTIHYTQWLNPCERKVYITQSKVDFYKIFIKKGDLAIDIGAHSGDTTIPMALAAGVKGMVIALDPNVHVFKILEQNSKLNTLKTNILPLCVAATSEDGEFFYNSSEATFNNGGISVNSNSPHGRYALNTKVKGINLNTYLRQNHFKLLKKLSFIKIDTEGLDKEVIISVLSLISEFRPTIIAECFKRLKKQDRFELFGILDTINYHLYHLENWENNSKTAKINRDDMTKWKHFDFCAIPQERAI